MTDDKWGQPSNELSVGATSDLTYGCPHLSRESLGGEEVIPHHNEGWLCFWYIFRWSSGLKTSIV